MLCAFHRQTEIPRRASQDAGGSGVDREEEGEGDDEGGSEASTEELAESALENK